MFRLEYKKWKSRLRKYKKWVKGKEMDEQLYGEAVEGAVGDKEALKGAVKEEETVEEEEVARKEKEAVAREEAK